METFVCNFQTGQIAGTIDIFRIIEFSKILVLPILRGRWGDVDDAINHLHLITRHLPARAGVFLANPGFDVKLPSVPGAFDEVSFYGSLAQWPSGMRTGIIQGIDHTIEIKERNTVILELNASTGPWREILNLSNRVEIWGHSHF